jgi:hypothetical protein
LQSTTPTATTTSPTKNFFSGYLNIFIFFCNYLFHLDQPFTQTTSSSNDANWGAFVETTKHPTPILTNTPLTNAMSMPTNTFAHPPPEPVSFFFVFIQRNFFYIKIFRLINMLLFLNYSVHKIQYKIINLPHSEIQLMEVLK